MAEFAVAYAAGVVSAVAVRWAWGKYVAPKLAKVVADIKS